MKEGMAYGGLLCTACFICYVADMIDVWDTVSTFIFLIRIYLPTEFFLNNGLENIQWASFISELHAKLRTFNRRVPGFATDLQLIHGCCMMLHLCVCYLIESGYVILL